MKTRLTAGLLSVACIAPAMGDEAGDPTGLLTHELTAAVSYYTIHESESQVFAPASYLAECIHAEIAGNWWARVGAADQCSSTADDVDIVAFDWSNMNLGFPSYGITALGTATSTISTIADAELSIESIENLGELSAQADWSIEIHEGSSLIGTLNDMETTFQLAKDTAYELVFSMGGSDTRTTDGATVTWNMAVAYASSGGAVPGAGGIAAFAGLAAGRRRRRR